MTKVFPIIVPVREEHAEDTKTVYGRKVRSIPFYLGQRAIEFCVIVLILYLCIAAIHGAQYRSDSYVCHHMARDLEDTLESFGFTVEIVTGWTDEDVQGRRPEGSAGHAWVRVNGIDIDSVWLVPYVIDNEYRYDRKVYEDYVDYATYTYPEAELRRLGLAGKL